MKLDHIYFSFTMEYIIQQNIQNQMESTIIVSYNFIEVTESQLIDVDTVTFLQGPHMTSPRMHHMSMFRPDWPMKSWF